MILNNARQIFAGQTAGSQRTLTSLGGNNLTTWPFTGSDTWKMWASMCGWSNVYHNFDAGSSYLEVGFGDTAVTAADYDLADSNLSNPKLTCVASGKNSPNGTDLINTYANFRNDGSSNVVVKEIGVVGVFNSQSSINAAALMYRKVLDTPVTIAPGETYNFNYKIRIR